MFFSDLLLGVCQRISITISVGPGTVEKDSKLEITSSTQLLFHLISGTAYISSNLDTNTIRTEQPYKVSFPSFHEGVDPTSSVAIVTLPKCGPYEKLEFDLLVEGGLNKQSEQKEDVEHCMTFCCKWLQPTVASELVCSFRRPLTVRHVLHCSNEQYVFLRTMLYNKPYSRIDQLYCQGEKSTVKILWTNFQMYCPCLKTERTKFSKACLFSHFSPYWTLSCHIYVSATFSYVSSKCSLRIRYVFLP